MTDNGNGAAATRLLPQWLVEWNLEHEVVANMTSKELDAVSPPTDSPDIGELLLEIDRLWARGLSAAMQSGDAARAIPTVTAAILAARSEILNAFTRLQARIAELEGKS